MRHFWAPRRLRARAFQHALGRALREPGGGEIVILDVDGALGTVDGIEEQRYALANLGFVVGRRIGAGNPDVDVGEVGCDAVR